MNRMSARMSAHTSTIALCLGALLPMPADAKGMNEPLEIQCGQRTDDPRVTRSDAFEIRQRGAHVDSLTWSARITTKDGADSSAVECQTDVGGSRYDVHKTARGSLAILKEDRSCRFDVRRTKTMLRLVPSCASECRGVSAKLRPMVIDLGARTCRPLVVQAAARDRKKSKRK